MGRRAVWVDHDVLMQAPTSGAAWEALLSYAKAAKADGANLVDFGSNHSRGIYAAALAGVRLNDATLIAKAQAGLMDAIGTEEGAEWVGPARVLGAYILAADVLGIHDGPIYDWLKRFTTRTLQHNNQNKQITLRQSAWGAGSNGDSQLGFVATALAVYLGDQDLLGWCWAAFRRYCGDITSPHRLQSNQFGDPWQVVNDDEHRVGILPKGAVKNGMLIDGVIANDMGRSNPAPKTGPLAYDSRMSLYPWVGLNGAALCALVFHRQSFPGFELQDRAILRAFQCLRRIDLDNTADWWQAAKKEDAKWIICKAYNLPFAEYPCSQPVGPYDMVGFVDVTHANGI